MCLYPSIIRNPKYKKNKKNRGRVPWANDPRILYIPIGCGECIECRRQKVSQWKIRLKEEIKTDKSGKFVTLTINDIYYKQLASEAGGEEKYEKYNNIIKLAIRRFTERWRKKHTKTIKHWLTSEIGHNGTKRLHLHGLLFSDNIEDIKKVWGYGYVYVGNYVTEKSINYITKYITKIDTENKGYKPRIYVSKGIGKEYTDKTEARLNRYKPNETQDKYKNKNGTETALPIYYRNKIYTEKQREQLWIEKLNKNERFVLGQKFDVSTTEGDYQYQKAVKVAQEKNERLGYGKKQDWNKEEYDNQLLEINHRFH
nr:MAG: replication initiator protein [Microviridae sp.]